MTTFNVYAETVDPQRVADAIARSAYERITAKRDAARRLPCRRNHDGTHCVLEPLHDDWHADGIGRRWP